MENEVSVVRCPLIALDMPHSLSYLLAPLAAHLVSLRFSTIPTFVDYILIHLNIYSFVIGFAARLGYKDME